MAELAVDDALTQYDERERLIGEEQIRAVERAVMLSIVDARWKDHLLDMDYMQEGIHLRALGQRDPLAEYKTEGYNLFEDMLGGVRQSVVMTLLKNMPEDLAYFAAMTFDQPMLQMNYTSGDDLAYQTSFAGAAVAAGATSRPGAPATGMRRRRRPRERRPCRLRRRRCSNRSPCSSATSNRSWGATTRAGAGRGRNSRSVTALRATGELARPFLRRATPLLSPDGERALVSLSQRP